MLFFGYLLEVEARLWCRRDYDYKNRKSEGSGCKQVISSPEFKYNVAGLNFGHISPDVGPAAHKGLPLAGIVLSFSDDGSSQPSSPFPFSSQLHHATTSPFVLEAEERRFDMLSLAGNRTLVLGARRNARGLRFSSTQAQGPKPVSPHVSSAQSLAFETSVLSSCCLDADIFLQVGFYKTFARPIAKVLLMATFTYQLAYWAWVKLEKDEVRRNRTGERWPSNVVVVGILSMADVEWIAEIEVLEKQLGDMTKGKEAKP